GRWSFAVGAGPEHGQSPSLLAHHGGGEGHHGEGEGHPRSLRSRVRVPLFLSPQFRGQHRLPRRRNRRGDGIPRRYPPHLDLPPEEVTAAVRGDSRSTKSLTREPQPVFGLSGGWRSVGTRDGRRREVIWPNRSLNRTRPADLFSTAHRESR